MGAPTSLSVHAWIVSTPLPAVSLDHVANHPCSCLSPYSTRSWEGCERLQSCNSSNPENEQLCCISHCRPTSKKAAEALDAMTCGFLLFFLKTDLFEKQRKGERDLPSSESCKGRVCTQISRALEPSFAASPGVLAEGWIGSIVVGIRADALMWAGIAGGLTLRCAVPLVPAHRFPGRSQVAG